MTIRRNAARQLDIDPLVPGRPADGPAASKREIICDAATRTFLREGYGASMDAVAAAAGVSKQTIYHHFGSKEALFRAIVEDLTGEFLNVLEECERVSDDPARTLSALARVFLSLVLSPKALALHRIVVCEAARFPDLAREVYDAGPGRTVSRLADWIERQDRRGLLKVADPKLAAEQFFGALVGQVQLRALLGLSRPQQRELERAAQHAVETFLRGHAVT